MQNNHWTFHQAQALSLPCSWSQEHHYFSIWYTVSFSSFPRSQLGTGQTLILCPGPQCCPSFLLRVFVSSGPLTHLCFDALPSWPGLVPFIFSLCLQLIAQTHCRTQWYPCSAPTSATAHACTVGRSHTACCVPATWTEGQMHVRCGR